MLIRRRRRKIDARSRHFPDHTSGTTMSADTLGGPRPASPGSIRPFTIDLSRGDIDDLRARVARSRFPEKEPVADNSQGVPLEAIQALTDYWESEYDFGRLAA